METYKTIAIINDPKVTLGSLSHNEIEIKNAWDVDWDSLSENNKYIILGGHMGAYDTDEFPYLAEEKRWLKKIISNGSKVLGICLGAQLIAEAMGGRAYLSNEIEFGFKKLNFHTDYKLFSGFKNSEVFLWHRDTFSIPPSAQLIAETEFPQIFKIYNSYALQFHPEVTKSLFDDWFDSDVSRSELAQFDTSATLDNLVKNAISLKKEVNLLFEKWLRI